MPGLAMGDEPLKQTARVTSSWSSAKHEEALAVVISIDGLRTVTEIDPKNAKAPA
jgi:hypothetical protein